jgi:hypothetical protein
MRNNTTGPYNHLAPSASRGESRRLERFDLKLPSRIYVLEPGNPTLDLMTENISADGAFFPTREPLPEGFKVLVEITLRRESGEGMQSKVKVKGTVVRSQADGMAVRFEKGARISPLT